MSRSKTGRPSVYLAGPITGLTYDDGQDWREYARTWLDAEGIDGYSPLRAKQHLRELGVLDNAGTPQSAYIGLNALSEPKGIMTRDRFDCTGRSLVLVNFVGAERISVGTCIELGWADGARVPIVIAMEEGKAHTVPREELGWLACLIDGEGCIHISRRPTTHGHSYQPRIAVSMKCEAMVARAYELAGLGQFRHTGRGLWTWQVVAQEAAAVLEQVYPFLIEKRKQAAAALLLAATARDRKNNVASGKMGFQPLDDPDLFRERERIYQLWQTAQRREEVVVPEPQLPTWSNVHRHAMVNESAGFIVPSLEEALVVCKAVLLP